MAKQAMTPRPDMICINSGITTEELKAIIDEYQYTRYPVYENDLDHIIGMVHIKDIYPTYYSPDGFNLNKIIRKPMLVPETNTIDNLLVDLKKEKQYMAVVVDEFGGTSGLITIEDILEEIFGEVQDEFDFEEPEIQTINENEYLVTALTRIDQINELLILKLLKKMLKQ